MAKIIFTILLLIPLWATAQNTKEKVADRTMEQLSDGLKSEFRILRAAIDAKDTAVMAHSYGNVGKTYLEIAKQPLDGFRESDSVSGDQKVNLNKSVEYLNKSISMGEVTGDINLLKNSYKTLSAAQKLQGNVAGALDSYRKMMSLKRNSKKALKIEQKQLQYRFGKREDSLITGKQVVEKHLEKQTIELTEKQKHLEKQTIELTEKQKQLEQTSQVLAMTERDKELQAADLKLKQSELAYQKSQLELQNSKVQLQKDELAEKDRDIEEHKRARNFFIAGLAALFIISLLAYRTIRIQKKLNLALFNEKKRSENLLLNILPAEVAEELKEKGFADAKHFFDVTVLFTDFVSFTSMVETMPPQQLVSELHVCFKAFDDILGKYQIEKIKTVGDAYLAVSGLPAANPRHAADIISAAIEIRDFMRERSAELGKGTFRVRIGISSGNVVAGIVGVRKYSYDIWGDTVNTAARMEQNSEEGKINISETTYQLVKDKYRFTHRGKIEAKNKGSIDMYYLDQD